MHQIGRVIVEFMGGLVRALPLLLLLFCAALIFYILATGELPWRRK